MAKQKKVTKQIRGFAAMDPEKQREIARKGGSAHHSLRGFQAMDPKLQREIARKGGKSKSKSSRIT